MADTTFVNGTVITADWLNDVNKSVYTYFVNVKSGDNPALGNGSPGDAAKIQAFIDDAYIAGGGTIYIPRGIYGLETSLDRKPGVFLKGEGAEFTALVALGDFPVVQTIGTISDVKNRGGISDILIRGSGKTNANSIGIREEWTNRTIYQNVRIHSCRFGMFASNVWQVKWDNIQADGGGSDQNYIGFYMAEVDPANQNNAVNAINCTAQGVEKYGWRLINFNGSKFVSCEGLDGEHGWYLGDPTTGTEAIRWGHFSNCLADTNSSHNWRLEKGSASSFEQVVFVGCWAGNSGDNGWRVAGCSRILFTGCMVMQSSSRSFYFELSSRCVISGGQLLQYNIINTGQAAIWIQESQFIIITGNHMYSDVVSSKAVVEFGGSTNNNLVIGNNLQGDVTLLGVDSRFYRNMSSSGEKAGSTSILAANTTSLVSHGLSYTPSINDVRITPRDNMGLATKFWVSNMTATTFVLNVDTAPGADTQFAWAVDHL